MVDEPEEEAVLRAREDPSAFIEYCFLNERGDPLRQAAHHREWQRLLSGHEAVAILGAAESGKTQQMGMRMVWDLGKNPEGRTFVISASQGGAKKILGVVKRAIESNERVRRVFPLLKPGTKWTESELLIQRKRLETKDYSVQAYGAASEILGGRADRILVDDINNLQNSRTSEAREKIVAWFDSIVQSRLVADGRVAVTGNAWNSEDLIHTLMKRGGGWVVRRYPVLDETNRPTWPEQFPLSRLAKIRGRMTALAFARMYLCLPASDEDSRFEESWFEAAKGLGRGLPWSPAVVSWPTSVGVGETLFFTGVDLASGKRGRKRKTDTHALFTIAYHVRSRTFMVVDVQVGRWKSPEIIARMRQLARRYDPLFAVEDNGVQQLFVDFAAAETPEERRSSPKMRVLGLTTSENKWDPAVGIEGMAVDFEHQRWIVPAVEAGLDVAPEVEQWLRDLLHFTPAEHTSDVVIASWIAWTAARKLHGNPFGVNYLGG